MTLPKSIHSIIKPPPSPLSWLEFARTIRLPDGPYAGQYWDPESEPAQFAQIKAMDGGRFRSFVNVAPSQVGKSLLAAQCPALKFSINDRMAVGYVLPTLEILDRNWLEKIKPGIEGAGFGAYLPEKGPGSRGGRPKSVRFKDPNGGKCGSLVFMAAGSGGSKETSLASTTLAAQVVDEADDFEDVQHVQLALARTAAFGADGWSFISCTVNKDEDSVILAFYEQSTKGRLWVPCLACGAYQTLDFDRMHYEGETVKEAKESARLICKHCEHAHGEHERHEMLREAVYAMQGQTVDGDGEILGPEPVSDRWGILTTQLDYHLGMGLPELASEHLQAKQAIERAEDHSPMRFHYRKRWSMQYTEDREAITLDNKGLALLSNQCGLYKRQVPKWAEWLTIAIDVQKDRIYWQVMAHARANRFHIVDWGFEFLEPDKTARMDRSEYSREEYHAVFSKIDEDMRDGWQIEGSEERMTPARGGIDTGYQEDTVTEWLQGHPGWHGIKGRDKNPTKSRADKDAGRKDTKVITQIRDCVEIRKTQNGPLWFVSTHHMRLATHRGLLLASEKPGSGSIPRDSNGIPLAANDMLCLHLTAELWTRDEKTGKWFWREIRKRNDLLDCAVYNQALGRFEAAARGLDQPQNVAGDS